MSAARSSAAAALYAAALVDRALRISSADRRAAEAELASVQRASEATVAWARGVEGSYRKRATRETREWVDALAELFVGIEDPDDDIAIAALARFQRRMGHTPAFDDVATFLAACHSEGPVVLGRRAGGQSDSLRPKDRARALGTPCAAPLAGPASAILAALVSDAEERWARSGAGLHLAVNRRGRPHHHHGIYLGDGSVVHFAGEGLSQRGAKVVREPLRKFVSPDGVHRTRSLVPVRQSGERVAALDPAVTCLRALSRLGETGYQLVANNCEHFSAWSQLGASVSFQTQRAQVLSIKGKMHEVVASALDQRLQLIGDSLADDILLDGWDDAYPIDLARARWSSDRGLPLIYFPVFDCRHPTVSGFERPWAVGPLRMDADWHSAPPTLELDEGWHASLIAFSTGDAYWLTSDGVWVREPVDPLAVVARRLEITQELIEALVAPPSKAAQRAVNLAEALLRQE